MLSVVNLRPVRRRSVLVVPEVSVAAGGRAVVCSCYERPAVVLFVSAVQISPVKVRDKLQPLQLRVLDHVSLGFVRISPIVLIRIPSRISQHLAVQKAGVQLRHRRQGAHAPRVPEVSF